MVGSNPAQVDPDRARREAFRAQRNVPDLLYPERRLEVVARKLNVSYLALSPHFQQLADETGVYLHGYARTKTLGIGHWNVKGHRQAGLRLADRICAVVKGDTPIIDAILPPAAIER